MCVYYSRPRSVHKLVTINLLTYSDLFRVSRTYELRSGLIRIIFQGKLKCETRFCTGVVSHECHTTLRRNVTNSQHDVVTCVIVFGIWDQKGVYFWG